MTDETSNGLRVGARVEIVASETITSCFVGMCGEIERLTKPYWMARVKLDDYEDLFTCWVEELRVLAPLEALEEMHAVSKVPSSTPEKLPDTSGVPR